MIQKIITSIYHAVSNPQSFFVIDFVKIVRLNVCTLSNNKSYPTFFVSTIHTRCISLVSLRTQRSLNFLLTKKLFFCCKKLSHNFYMLTKIFVDIIFSKFFFQQSNISALFIYYISFIFLLEEICRKYSYISPAEIYLIFFK